MWSQTPELCLPSVCSLCLTPTVRPDSPTYSIAQLSNFQFCYISNVSLFFGVYQQWFESVVGFLIGCNSMLMENTTQFLTQTLYIGQGYWCFLSRRRSLFSVESCRFLVGGKFEAHFWWPFATMTLFTRVMILSALLSTVLTTNRLCLRWWLEFQFKYWSVWGGFL